MQEQTISDGGQELIISRLKPQRLEITFDSFRQFVASQAAWLSQYQMAVDAEDDLAIGSTVSIEARRAHGSVLVRALGRVLKPVEESDQEGFVVQLIYIDPASAALIESMERHHPAVTETMPPVEGADSDASMLDDTQPAMERRTVIADTWEEDVDAFVERALHESLQDPRAVGRGGEEEDDLSQRLDSLLARVSGEEAVAREAAGLIEEADKTLPLRPRTAAPVVPEAGAAPQEAAPSETAAKPQVDRPAGVGDGETEGAARAEAPEPVGATEPAVSADAAQTTADGWEDAFSEPPTEETAPADEVADASRDGGEDEVTAAESGGDASEARAAATEEVSDRPVGDPTDADRTSFGEAERRPARTEESASGDAPTEAGGADPTRADEAPDDEIADDGLENAASADEDETRGGVGGEPVEAPFGATRAADGADDDRETESPQAAGEGSEESAADHPALPPDGADAELVAGDLAAAGSTGGVSETESSDERSVGIERDAEEAPTTVGEDTEPVGPAWSFEGKEPREPQPPSSPFEMETTPQAASAPETGEEPAAEADWMEDLPEADTVDPEGDVDSQAASAAEGSERIVESASVYLEGMQTPFKMRQRSEEEVQRGKEIDRRIAQAAAPFLADGQPPAADETLESVVTQPEQAEGGSAPAGGRYGSASQKKPRRWLGVAVLVLLGLSGLYFGVTAVSGYLSRSQPPLAANPQSPAPAADGAGSSAPAEAAGEAEPIAVDELTAPAEPDPSGLGAPASAGPDVATAPARTDEPAADQRAPGEPVDPAAAVQSVVEAWRSAWSDQDVERYLARYSPDFRPANGASRESWANLRRQRLRAPSSIEVQTTSMEVKLRSPDRASVAFEQVYVADGVRRLTWKTLDLAREGGDWKITAERIGRHLE